MNEDTTNPISQNASVGLLFNGKKIESPKRGEKQVKVLSASWMSQIVAVCNAMLSAKVNRSVDPDESGTVVPTGRFRWSGQNLVLDLVDVNTVASSGTGTANVVTCQVISESTAYVTCQPVTANSDGSYSNVGAQIKVAKPYKLRTVPYTGAVCDPTYDGIIFAVQNPTTGTGVFVGGVDVGYIDINADARRWPDDVQQFIFLKSFGDYFLAQNSRTSVTTQIAKPYKLRNSITFAWMYGTEVTYSYPHNPASWATTTSDALAFLYRTATIGGFSRNEGITPPYIKADGGLSPAQPGDIIYATKAYTGILSVGADSTTSVNTPIVWLDDNRDGRAWTDFADQTF